MVHCPIIRCSSPEEVYQADSFQIHQATDQDYADICSLEQGLSGCGYQAAVFIRQSMALWPDMVLTARIGRGFAGYLIAAPSQSRESAWILRLRVQESFRRQGIGTALLASVCSHLKDTGVATIYLSCSPENEPALALYIKAGFARRHYEKEYFGPGEDRVVLSCEL